MARKVNAPLHGFFRPAKKPMQFSHGFGLYGEKNPYTFA
jgi:hypothetical protein